MDAPSLRDPLPAPVGRDAADPRRDSRPNVNDECDCRNKDGGSDVKITARKTALSMILLLALVIAESANAAPPAAWPASKAEAQVVAKVRVPWCRVYASNPAAKADCVDGKPVTDKARTAFAVARATCRGTVAVGARYRQFVCEWAGNNDIARGRVQVYVTGATSFRWRSATAIR